MSKVQDENRTLRRVSQHLLALGFTKAEVSRYTDKIRSWLRNSGAEWTVERLKSLKQAMVTMLSTGDHYVVPQGWATRQNREGKTIFKDSFVHEVFSKAFMNRKVAEGFLRVYTSIKLVSLSEKQAQKLVAAVESDEIVCLSTLMEEVRKNHSIRRVGKRKAHHLYSVGSDSKVLFDYINGTKRAPYWESITGIPKTAPRTEVKVFDFEELLSKDKSLHLLWKKHPHAVSYRLTGSENYPYFYEHDADFVDVPAGVLSALQEGGTKVRWIANPSLVLQSFGEPLKDRLFAYAKNSYPEVKTHDQDSGREDAMRWILEGRKVYSYDCSSFTDRFPVKIQEYVLEQLREMNIIDEFDVDSFDLVMSKSWYSKDLGRTIRWKVGQPLGYNPSFHLATIAHAMVLDSLDSEKSHLWRVVGDDVIIADESLAHKYHSFMTVKCGVEINSSKSVISTKMAEFLGKLIFPNGVNDAIKVKIPEEESQYVKLMAYYGPDFLKFANKEEYLFCLAAFLPVELGGLGIAPEGMSYSDFVSCLDTDKIREALLLSEVREFHDDKVRSGRFLAESSFLEVKSQIMTRNSKTLSTLGLGDIISYLRDSSIFLNGMTGLPAITPARKRSESSTVDTSWCNIVDKMWYLSDNAKITSVLSDDEAVVRFTKHGYSLNKFKGNSAQERRSNLKSTTLTGATFNSIKDRNRENDQYPKQSIKLFNREGRRKIIQHYNGEK